MRHGRRKKYKKKKKISLGGPVLHATDHTKTFPQFDNPLGPPEIRSNKIEKSVVGICWGSLVFPALSLGYSGLAAIF